MAELPKMITPKELMTYLSCSRDTAYALCKRRDFPSVKIGKKFFILVDKLPEWLELESHKVKTDEK